MKACAGEWTQKLSRRIRKVLVLLQICLYLIWERNLGDERPAHKMTGQNESG